MMEADLLTLVTGAPAVSALIGANMYPGKTPKSAVLPAITYQRVAADETSASDGPVKLVGALMQLNAWMDGSAGYLKAKQIRDALRDLLNGYSGTVGVTVFRGIFKENERDLYVPPAENEETGTQGVGIDFRVWYVE